MNNALIPGSFDPVTLGHLDIITRAAAIFPKVYVSVLVNSGKNPLFSIEERKDLLRKVTSHLPNVEVDSFSGLLTDYLQTKDISIVVKGIRSARDAEYELEMHMLNKQLDERVETLFLPTDPRYFAISSSAVKEIASLGGRLDGFVPKEIIGSIREKFSK